ncbi:MAG: LytTR family DNA-binding domain-containing protein [Burkholderiaceae bacterium]
MDTTMDATALIAEDEPLLADALRAELQRQWPSLRIVAIARNGLEAADLAVRLRPDVAFLDIRMPGASGLDVAQSIAEDWDEDQAPPLLVFVTAYDEFAVRAFEQSAVDYLLKPVHPPRLARCLQRVRDRLAARRLDARAPGEAPLDTLVAQLQQVLGHPAIEALAHGGGSAPGGAAAPDARSGHLRTIMASVGDTVHMLPIDTVVYLQASDKYVNVVTADAEFLIREPLKDLLPRLDPARFAQVHRGTVVNLDEVAAAVRDERGRTLLKLRSRSAQLPVSRLYQHRFRPM